MCWAFVEITQQITLLSGNSNIYKGYVVMKKFTVVGFYEETRQIFSHHVHAENSKAAFVVVSKMHSDAVFVAVLDGFQNEERGIDFPGAEVVDAETVLSQAGVFGTGDPPPFEELESFALVEWMKVARSIADDRGDPIDEDDCGRAEQEAKHHYYELGGIIPVSKSPIQDIASELKLAMAERGDEFSGETKRVSIRLSALTRREYTEEIAVPVEFDSSVLEHVVADGYEEVDGTEFHEDPDYWEKGDCSFDNA